MANIKGVLETVIYASDLESAHQFYVSTLGLQVFSFEPGQHLFLRCGDEAMLLIFDLHGLAEPAAKVNGVPIPKHGAVGPIHVCFRLETANELSLFVDSLRTRGVEIEAEIQWPHGPRSFYVRDPFDNSVEFSTAALWQIG